MSVTKSIEEQIKELRSLEYNYDSYFANPPTKALIDRAESLLLNELKDYTPRFMYCDSKDGSCLWLVFQLSMGTDLQFILSEKDSWASDALLDYTALYSLPSKPFEITKVEMIGSTDPNEVGSSIITASEVLSLIKTFLRDNYKNN